MLDLDLIEATPLDAVPAALAGELSDAALEPGELAEHVAFGSLV